MTIDQDVCQASITDRNDEHRVLSCTRPRGHDGAHSCFDATWTTNSGELSRGLESDALREAVRFAEDYGYNRWQQARDEHSRLTTALHSKDETIPVEDYERLKRIEEAAKEAAHLMDGLEGMTAQRMHMRGVSPVKLLGEIRDLLRQALTDRREIEGGS